MVKRLEIGKVGMCGLKGMLLDLLIFSLFNILTAAAATVPQDSPEKYYFSRPNLPSNIVGRIMGNPPEYSVMRSEDIAWLYEAYMERQALIGDRNVEWTGPAQTRVLAPEYGLWALSETNRFARWVSASVTTNGLTTTNIVVGYNYTTNYGSGVDRAHIEGFSIFTDYPPGPYEKSLSNPDCDDSFYLSTNDDLLVSAPTVVQGGGYVTNVWLETCITNLEHHTNSVITMTMTNGTTSVYTNSWQFSITGQPYQVAHTNIRLITDIDRIFSRGMAVGYTNMLTNEGYFWGPYRAGAVTNIYPWLDGARRRAVPMWYTNHLVRWEYSWAKGETPEDQESSSVEAGLFRFRYGTDAYAWLDNDGPHSQETWDGAEEYPRPSEGTFVFCGTVTTNALMAGGVNRLGRARLWSVVYVNSTANANAFGSGNYNSWQTNRAAYVAMPVGDMAQVDSSPAYGNGRDLLLSCQVNLRSIYETALATAGIAVPERGTHPPLHFPLPTPTESDSASSSTWATTYGYLYFVVVLDFNPWTQMPGGTQ